MTCRLWPPPAAHPGTTAMTTLGMKRMSRCTSRMWSRPVRAGSTVVDVVTGRVLVAVPAPDALVAARAERPPPVDRRRPVARQQHAADVRALAGVVEDPVELVDGAGPEGVAHLGPVEGHPHRAVVERAVVGDVGEVEPVHLPPRVGVEERRRRRIHGDRAYGPGQPLTGGLRGRRRPQRSGRPRGGRSPRSTSSGSCSAQMSWAFQHRVRNRQPDGGVAGLGGSPAARCAAASRSLLRVGLRARPRAGPGCRGGPAWS